jgi:coiled-coil domain-containing protein 55
MWKRAKGVKRTISKTESGSSSNEDLAGPSDVSEAIRARQARAVAEFEANAARSQIASYDEDLDVVRAQRQSEGLKKKEASKDKRPRYMQNLLLAAQEREKEREIAYNRVIIREKEKESSQFPNASDEMFMTQGYQERLEQHSQWQKDLDKKDAEVAKRDVTRSGMMGFYASILDARTSHGDEEVTIPVLKPSKGTKPVVSLERPRLEPDLRDFQQVAELKRKRSPSPMSKTLQNLEKERLNSKRTKVDEAKVLSARERYLARKASTSSQDPI